MTYINLSQAHAKELNYSQPYAMISIVDNNSEDVKFNFDENRKHLLRLRFDDITAIPTIIGGNGGEDFILFNDDHAKQIINFIKEVDQDHNIHTVFVHCYAGICRSSAVCAALSRLEGQDDSYYFKHFTPNMLVYKTMLKEGDTNECLHP